MMLVEREPSGIRELLEHNPMVGEPRCGARRFWTGREEKLLREAYPTGGVTACLAVLPGRSASSIFQRAGMLGLRKLDGRGKVKERQRWTSTDAIDGFIRRTYQAAPTKKAILQCASLCGRPRWWISKRAAHLCLVAPRFKELAWSEAEIELLQANAHKVPAALRRILAKAGYQRTETAIIVKLKRLGADRTDPDHLTAGALAAVMGIDAKGVTAWIAKGWLKAKRRGTERTTAQGGDQWWIHRRDVRRFIVENVAAVDLRKVEKHWFVDLLAGRAE